jgi:hypothetical protein
MFEKFVYQEKQILSVQFLSIRMNESGGEVLVPCPTLNVLSSSKETPCILNACPLCGLWFSCRNYLTASCRHTYHPSCMVEHAHVFSNCVIPFYEVIFITNWCTTWGFEK